MSSGAVTYSELFNGLGPGADELKQFTTAVGELNRNFKAFAKNVDGDGQRIAAGLAAIKGQTAELRTQTAALSTAALTEGTSLRALAAEVSKLAQQQQQLQQAEAGATTTKKVAEEATKSYTAELRKQRDALREAYTANDAQAIVKAATAIQNLKTQTEDLNRALRGANSAFTAANGSYRAMENEARSLDGQLKALAGGMQADSTEAQQLKARLAEVNQAMISFGRDVNSGYRNVGRYAESIIEAVGALEKQKVALLANTQALTTQGRATGLSAAQQEKLQTEIKQTEAELGKVNGQLRNYGVGVQAGSGLTAGFGKGVAGLAQSFAGAYFGIQGLANGLQQVFEKNVQYSDAAADVAKTTNASTEEVNALAAAFKQLDTRSSLAELLDIAKVGGQLGIAKEDLLEFTKAVDIANQALGDDFKGNAEQIATELGKIAGVFRKELGPDVAQNLLAIGSAVNEIGAQGAATAPFLADVALRVGAVAATTGVGLKNVLAYAAVLEETGETSEKAGTSLNRLFSTLSTRTQESFKIAQKSNPALTLKEFTRLVNTDFNAAVQLFLRGLNEGGTSTTKLNKMLATLKLQSGDAKNVIITLAQNLDLYAQRQQTANDQLRDATSLSEEAKKKNDNLAGSWSKLTNEVGNFFTSGTAGNVLKFLVDSTRLLYSRTIGDVFRGIGNAVSYVGEKTGLATKPQVDYTVAIVSSTQALTKQAAAAQTVLDAYSKLGLATSRSATEELEFAKLRAKLLADYGTADVDQIQARIAAKQAEAAANKKVLKTNLAAQDEYLTKIKLQTAGLQQDATEAQAAFSARFKLGPEGLKNVQDAARSGALSNTLAGRNFPAEQVAGAKELNRVQDALAASTTQLTAAERTRAQIAAALAKLGPGIVKGTKDQTSATDDDTEADKKKKQAVADLAKAEYERQKQLLEFRIVDLDQQTQNPANDPALRVEAARKATATRDALAVLSARESGRVEAEANKDKINGDQATAIARARFSDLLRNTQTENARKGAATELAIANALADQLGELDKLTIAAELTALDAIVANEGRSFDERQQAAADASARRIELVSIEAEAQVRAAQGNATKIKAIRLKEADDTTTVLKGTGFNAERANQGVAIDYEAQQTELEQARAKGLVTERGYEAAVRALHLGQLREELANLETGLDNEKAISAKKLEIAKAESDEKVRLAAEAERKKQAIIQESLQLLGNVSDAYFTIESQNNQAAAENYQHQKDAELAVAGDNAELKAQVEENAHKRELALKRKQAEQDRQQALFNVAISTAQGVMRAVAEFPETFGLPFSAFVVAAGLAQVSAIEARPLPNYFVGRANGPAELAVVAERGPELIGQPGSFRLAAHQGITQLAAGDRVFTAPETRDVMRDHELIAGRLVNRRQQQDTDQQTASLRSAGSRAEAMAVADARAQHQQARLDTERIVKALQELPLYQIEEDGIFRYTQKQQNVTKTRASRYKKDQ